jgi:hypothetical protein
MRAGVVRVVFVALLTVASSAALAEYVVFYRDVVRVGLGAEGRLALVKHEAFMNQYSIVDRNGNRLAFEWENPIADAGFLADGRCAYLVYDGFFRRWRLKAQDGQILWDFTDPTQVPASISLAADNAFYYVRRDAVTGWYQIVDRNGWPVYNGFHDPIGACCVVAPGELYFAVRDAFWNSDVLKDRTGRVVYRFRQDEEVRNVFVRAGRLTYVCRDTFFDRIVVREAVLGRETLQRERFLRLQDR